MGSGVDVDTALAVRGDIKSIVEQTGYIEASKKQDIYAVYGGRIKSIPVEVGQAIKEGQLLLEFDLDELNIRLDHAEAALALPRKLRPVPKGGGIGCLRGAAVQSGTAFRKCQTMRWVPCGLTPPGKVPMNCRNFTCGGGGPGGSRGEASQQASMAAARAEVSLIKTADRGSKALANLRELYWK